MPSVLVYSGAPLTAISNAQDRLANLLAQYEGAWTVEMKLYRANPASFSETDRKGAVLYTVTMSQHKNDVFVFGDDTSIVADKQFMPMMATKMQSLWLDRQTFKCEGHVYQLEGLTVRLANVFVQGNYKGLLVEISSDLSSESLIQKSREILNKCGIPGDVPSTISTTALEAARTYQVLNR